MTQRVQKILSQWGIASRRQAEQMILAGRVKLNGSVVTLGQQADPHTDCLEVDGKAIARLHRPQLVYLLLNKPRGYVSTCHDPQNRPTVMSLLPVALRQGQGIHPVGRLDRESTGALLLTNDGELTQKLTHPRYHLPKTYQVWVAGQPSGHHLHTWRQGMLLDNRLTLPAQVKVLKRQPEKTLLQVILTEGRNRQIRRIAQQLGLPVLKLHRTAIGNIRLQASQQPLLPSGHRYLAADEIAYLKKFTSAIGEPAFGEQRG